MGRNLYYMNGEGETIKLDHVKRVEHMGQFTEVEYKPFFDSEKKTTMIRTENIIRYDEN